MPVQERAVVFEDLRDVGRLGRFVHDGGSVLIRGRWPMSLSSAHARGSLPRVSASFADSDLRVRAGPETDGPLPIREMGSGRKGSMCFTVCR
ncbi:hypothetical protein GCM10010276_68390 [Streptomyces longisporus]|uniref:Uncharacterized protein n=1 Tax=Streptomyces longisporus TaxID=1948 RepID=A0ABN3MZI5_STRLO